MVRMTLMLMMALMKVRILPKVRMINDHDDGGGDDIDIRNLTSTMMRITTKAMIINGSDERLSRARCLANQG